MTILTAPLILKAYCAGVFPMSDNREDHEIFWVRPETRGIFPIDQFHIPKSMRRFIKKSPWKVTVNHAFADVIRFCAEIRTHNRQNSWINHKIEHVFLELHHQGYAHAFEVWDAQNQLIGGLYGLAIGGAFFGESMFSRQSGASKMALVACHGYLKSRNFKLFDTQFSNPHLNLFGCVDISADAYAEILKDALAHPVHFLIPPPQSAFNLQDFL